MESGKKYLCIFLSVCFLFTTGLLMFTRGFLLTRVTIEKSSTCTRQPYDSPFLDNNHEKSVNLIRGCWTPKLFSKAIIIIIDGLRYDFIHWDPKKDEKLYANKLTTVEELLKTKPHNSYLSKFVADSPTTTMQRIQGLTTGSLPTFIDVGKNFGTYEITEDNLIEQLITVGKRVVFMGDDTWESLFPKRFTKSFSFPSFNVKDLHSVDDGILKVLVPEIKNGDWDVLIAHFLGVDHCGHRFGPQHPAMADKLTQMNIMLRSVIDNIANDTILFLMGDHGMTEHGDHGGDSEDEVTSALFAYSPKKFHNFDMDDRNIIRQIDFVPTISLLLGIPIPFSNLGRVIKNFFATSEGKHLSQDILLQELYNTVLHLNVFQVNEFLEHYNVESNSLPLDSWLQLQNLFRSISSKFNNISSNVDIHQLQEECEDYLERALAMCQKVWAQFDDILMILGIGFILGTIILGFLLRSLKSTLAWKLCLLLFIASSSLLATEIIQSYNHSSLPFWLEICIILIGICLLGIWMKIVTLLEVVKWQLGFSLKNISTAVLMLYFWSFFSNSFVINEAAILNFFIQCLLWISLAIAVTSESSKASHINDNNTEKYNSYDWNKKTVLIFSLILISLSTRLSLNFLKCREEQYWCETSAFLEPLSLIKLSQTSLKHIWYFSVVMCHLAIPLLLFWWLKTAGNLNGHSLNVTSTKYFLILGSVCTCYYWTLQMLPDKLLLKLPSWHHLWIPRITATFLGVVVMCTVFSPMFIYVLPTQSTLKDIYPRTFSSISNVYFHLKNNWQKHFLSSSSSPSIPMVYGLASVYSANILVVTIAFTLISALLLSDRASLALALLTTSLISALNVCALTNKNVFTLPYINTSWSDVMLWGFLSSLFFYGTGHQPVLSAIPWTAAFIGSEGDFSSYILPAIKILTNLFCASVVLTVGLPLLVFWPYSLRIYFARSCVTDNVKEIIHEGEFLLFKDSNFLFSVLFRCILDYLLYNAVKMLATVCAAAFHRRHLMVWKIFAPRFIFEGVTFLLVQGILILTFLIVLRIHSSLNKWICNLEKEHSKAS